ncbi:MAG: hypothetical protein CENE_01982 [Candidatus Celerinatantimonas neptuna]|nr:MAG: hypothetical protein CENE_01982 [Candidatus Celerinatantimonas neptuna]
MLHNAAKMISSLAFLDYHQLSPSTLLKHMVLHQIVRTIERQLFGSILLTVYRFFLVRWLSSFIDYQAI